MKVVVKAAIGIALVGGLSFGQATFEVTGTPVPSDLLRANFGSLPKSLGAFDLDICNLTELRQTVISSKIYQSLALTSPDLQPVGRQLVLAAILRNQGRRPLNLLSIALTSVGGAFSVLSASKYALPVNWSSAIAFATVTGQQLVTGFKPVMTADQVETFDKQVLEPSFLLDGGSCEQRTVFTVLTSKVKTTSLSFHVR